MGRLPPVEQRTIPVLVEERRRLRKTIDELDAIGREHSLSDVLGPKIDQIGKAIDAIEAELELRCKP